jgi:protein-S-isoprenylcysteine O-methyltransferase Ste14
MWLTGLIEIRNDSARRDMQRLLVLAYGVTAYALFLGVFLYAIGFIGGFLTPTTLDRPLAGPLWTAIAVNLGLALLFALQHSIMARPAFKAVLTKIIPEPMERSTYVLATNLVMILLFWLWQPMGMTVWNIENRSLQAVMWTLYGFGWLTVFVTTLLINHFDLFGLRQVWLYFRGKPYTHLKFVTPGPYKFVRHPLYIGWLMAFWCTPHMGAAHLLFAVGMTAYILIAIQFEERDLVKFHPDYADYRRRVPMLIPGIGTSPREEAPSKKQLAPAAKL